MELTQEEWIRLLSEKHEASKEKVIATSKLRNIEALSIPKAQWKKRFGDLKGLELKQGREIELVLRDDGGTRIDLPQWSINQLALNPKDVVCVTEKEGGLYLKKLQLEARESPVPGWIVIDEFKETNVTRMYFRLADLEKIAYSELERLLSLMGRFHYDPLEAFHKMDGRLGLLARKEFFGGFTREDESDIQDYKTSITGTQQDNGSWEDSVAETSFSLIRLLEVGATVKDAAVARGIEWLLRATEPVGLPGLFMNTEERAREYNAKMSRGMPPGEFKGKRHIRYTNTERKAFLQHWDILPKALSCEPRVTWSSAMAIEALLRCGLHDHPRVVTAIQTLLSLRRGRWCGCGIFGRDVERPASADSIDFNQFPIPAENKELHRLDWFSDQDDIRKLVCGTDWNSCCCRAIDQNKGLLVKNHATVNPCSVVVHRALSFHPDYHDSNLEVIAALECSYAQNPNGEWPGEYLSSMFDFLSRFHHPLSAFLILRSVPLLIREQRPDGFWEENQGKFPPDKEVSTFMILSALKTYGFLDALIPC